MGRFDHISISRAGGLCLLLGLLIGAAPAAGGEWGVRVDPANTKRMEATPGQVVTVVFRVSNMRKEPRTFSAEVELPPGWRLVMPLPDYTLAPRAQEIRLVSFQVPSHTPAGAYEVRYAARDTADARAFDEGFIAVNVMPLHRVDLLLIEAARYVPAGDAYQAVFLAANEGNVAVAIDLDVYSSAGFAASLDSTRLHLPAQTTRRFSVTVDTRPDLRTKLRHVVQVWGRVEGGPEAALHASSSVEVIPAPERARGAGESYPAQVTLQAVGDEQRRGAQVRLDGSGPFLGGQLDLHLALPDQRQTSMYGDRSEYGLRYDADRLGFALGDQLYTLSPLTQAGRYGFGAGGRARAGDVSLGGFYQKSRYHFPQETQQAAFLAYDLAPSVTLSGQVLGRQGVREGKTFTLRSVLTPSPALRLDAECGLNGPGPEEGGACMVKVDGKRSWISYSGQFIHADPNYSGYYWNMDAKAGSVMLRPLKWLRLEGAWHEQEQGFTGGLRRHNRLYRLGTGVTGQALGVSGYVFLYYRGRSLYHTQATAGLDRHEGIVQVRSGFGTRRASLSGSVELGRSRSDSLGFAGTFRRYQVQARLSPWRGQTLSASVERLAGTTLYRAEPQHLWLARLYAGFQLGRRTRFMLNLYGNMDRSASQRTYRSVQAHLEHQFAFGHRIVMKGVYRSFGSLEQGTADYTLAYAVPLRLPAPPSKKAERITGRVYDAETGAGLKKVLLHLGSATTLTDSDGAFSFPQPPPGTHYLRLDRLSIGLDRVPLREMPMELHVGKEPASAIEVALVRSGRVTGRVELHEAGGVLGSQTARLPQLVLELTDAGGRQRALSDRNGHFAFSEVRPGPVTLRVVHARLPAYHYLEKDVYAFDVPPGGRQEVLIWVLPKRRQIRMIDTGTIMAGKRQESPSNGGSDTGPIPPADQRK